MEFSNRSFDLSKEKRGKRRVRYSRGRHLGEYLCLVFAKHKRRMGMAERERERDSFRAKETSSAKTLPRTSESSRAIARVNIENSPLIERIFQRERERERKVRIFYICARDARILTVTSVCLKQKSWRLFFSFESTDFFLFFPFLFLFLRREETAVEEVVHRSF